jgi:hypothetical protein
MSATPSINSPAFGPSSYLKRVFWRLATFKALCTQVWGGRRVLASTSEPRGGVEVELYSFFTLALGGGGWSAPCPGHFTPRKDPVPSVQEAGWASGPVWTCAKNLTPTGIRSPDRPARSQSLYRLSNMCICYLY